MASELGHNNPPTMIQTCDQVAEDISGWLAEHPVIEGEAEAKEAKLHLDRGKLSLKDMEDERDKAVRPLNEQVKVINEAYRPTKVLLGAILQETGERLSAYIQAEEEKRIAASKEAARLASEAEHKAREAERLEREAFESANAGELGVDLKASKVAADTAFKEYEKAAHQAQIAEKESHVRITGGFNRATSLRSVETLVVKDAIAAIGVLGVTKEIGEAIIKAARVYRKLFDELPEGVESTTERKI